MDVYKHKYLKYKNKYLQLGGFKCPEDNKNFRNATGQCWLDSILNVFLFSDKTGPKIQRQLLNSTDLFKKKKNKLFIPFNINMTTEEEFECYGKQFINFLHNRFINKFYIYDDNKDKTTKNIKTQQKRLDKIKNTKISDEVISHIDDMKETLTEDLMGMSLLKRETSIISSISLDKIVKRIINIDIKPEFKRSSGGSINEYLCVTSLFNYYFMDYKNYIDMDVISYINKNTYNDILENSFGVICGLDAIDSSSSHAVCFYSCGGNSYYYNDNNENTEKLLKPWKEKFINCIKLSDIHIQDGYKLINLKFFSIKQNDYFQDKLKFYNSVYNDYNSVSNIVTSLIHKRADVNVYDMYMNTPLSIAIKTHNNDITLLLLSNKDIEINKVNSYNETPFYIAVENNNVNIVSQLLLNEDIDINNTTSLGKTPLSIAVEENYINIVSLLLLNKNIKLNDINNKTLLHFAVEKNYFNIVELLLKKDNIDVNISDSNGNTPLHIAVGNEYTNIVELLLKKDNIDVNIKNEIGNTPLHMAVEYDFIEIIKKLLLMADVNITDYYGNTPLNIAVKNEKIDIVSLLLSKNDIDINIPDSKGNTPLIIATKYNNNDIILLLSKITE